MDRDTDVCICNDLTAGEIADFIKENNFTTLQELLDQDECPMGDKCESCRDEGFDNDGINLPLVLSMLKDGKL